MLTRFFYVFFIVLISTSISWPTLATTLKVAENLIVVEVDDKTVEHGFIGKKSSFELGQGAHALVVRYKDVFEDLDIAQDRVVESQDFVVKFTIEQQQQLSLTTEKITSLRKAEQFVKSPQLLLTDEKSSSLALVLAKLADYKLAKQVDKAVTSLAETKPKSSIAVAPTPAMKNMNSNTLMAESTPLPLTVNSLAMLHYWWQTASAEQKAQFKVHINNSQ